jgi:hypothetical protein
MIITADDSGVIKLWDIRSKNCMQSLSFGKKVIVNKLVSIYKEGKILFLGGRVNLMEFEET